VPTNRITHIINGRRAITADTALRLGHFFGTSAEFWLNLQKLYELRLAEQKSGAAVKALPRLRNWGGIAAAMVAEIYEGSALTEGLVRQKRAGHPAFQALLIRCGCAVE
jgi:hypothetical protein